MAAPQRRWVIPLLPPSCALVAIAAALLLTDGSPDQVVALGLYPLALCAGLLLAGVPLALFGRRAELVFALAGSCAVASYAVPISAMSIAPLLAYRAGGPEKVMGPVRAEGGWGWSILVVNYSEGETLCIRDVWLDSGWDFDTAAKTWRRFPGVSMFELIELNGFTKLCVFGVLGSVLGGVWARRRKGG